MDNFEKVEKIREKTGVSYEEAKLALEASNYDLLDAIVYLEKQGKVKEPQTASYSTSPKKEESQEFALAQATYESDCKRTSAGDLFKKFVRWCGKVFRKGCDTTFHVTKEGKDIISVPVIVLALVTVLAFWLVLILLAVGLFCDYKYYFEGFRSTTVDINDICEKASETCGNIKNDFQGK